MIDGFVLAGGRSSRMGTDKARLPFPDRWPMATHVGGVLAGLCERVVLVRRGDDGLPWPRPEGGAWEVALEAIEGDPHPLWGLATACALGRTPYVAVVSCDVPFLPVEAWRTLFDALGGGDRDLEATFEGAVSGAVIAACGDALHPLVGIWPRAVGPSAAEAARRGDSVRSFAAAARRVDLPASWLRNVNSWEDTGRDRTVLEALTRSLPWVVGPARDRLLAGEVERLRCRGARTFSA